MINGIVFSNTLIAILSPLSLLPDLRMKRLFRSFCDEIANSGWPFFVFGLEVIGRNRVIFYGDAMNIQRSEKSAIVISNHVSYIDWLMTFVFASRKGKIG